MGRIQTTGSPIPTNVPLLFLILHTVITSDRSYSVLKMEAEVFKPRVGPAGIRMPEDPYAKQHESD
jgi:hypothetical protein